MVEKENTLQLLDANYQFAVKENQPKDIFVGSVEAVHSNSSSLSLQNLEYNLQGLPKCAGGLLNIDSATGHLVTAAVLDYENVTQRVLMATVALRPKANLAQSNTTGLFSASAKVIVRVINDNESRPALFTLQPHNDKPVSMRHFECIVLIVSIGLFFILSCIFIKVMSGFRNRRSAISKTYSQGTHEEMTFLSAAHVPDV